MNAVWINTGINAGVNFGLINKVKVNGKVNPKSIHELKSTAPRPPRPQSRKEFHMDHTDHSCIF